MKLKHIARKILQRRLPESFFEGETELTRNSSDPESLSRTPAEPQEFEYIPRGWDYLSDHPEVKGWNVEDVLQVYIQQWDPFVEMVQGSHPLSGIHESVLA